MIKYEPLIPMGEYLQLPHTDRTDGFWGDYWLTVNHERDGLCAHGHIEAQGRGEEMMTHVIDELQAQADARGCTITHEFIPSTDRALKLALRTPGYTFAGTLANGNPVFRREYRSNR